MIAELSSVAIGGALGALTRFGLLSWAFARRSLAGRRWDGAARSTFLANVIGCAVFGLWTVSARGDFLDEIELIQLQSDASVLFDLFILTGFCGGLTTFSTAVADGVRLRAVRSAAASLGYAAATCAAGLLVLWLGLRFGA